MSLFEGTFLEFTVWDHGPHYLARHPKGEGNARTEDSAYEVRNKPDPYKPEHKGAEAILSAS